MSISLPCPQCQTPVAYPADGFAVTDCVGCGELVILPHADNDLTEAMLLDSYEKMVLSSTEPPDSRLPLAKSSRAYKRLWPIFTLVLVVLLYVLIADPLALSPAVRNVLRGITALVAIAEAFVLGYDPYADEL